jgi:putative transposase
MQRLNTWLAVNFNRSSRRRGRVLEAPYGAKLIENEEHLVEVARYIPLNPVRARMVARPEQYVWSSYRGTAGTAPRPRFLTTSWILSLIGGRERYPAWVAAGAHVQSIDEILLADPSSAR